MLTVVLLNYLDVEFLLAAYWESTLKISEFLFYFVHKVSYFKRYTIDAHIHEHTNARERTHYTGNVSEDVAS